MKQLKNSLSLLLSFLLIVRLFPTFEVLAVTEESGEENVILINDENDKVEEIDDQEKIDQEESDILGEDIKEEEIPDNQDEGEDEVSDLLTHRDEEPIIAEASSVQLYDLQPNNSIDRTPDFDGLLGSWRDFWTGKYQFHDGHSVTLFFQADESQRLPRVVRNNPERFNLNQVQTGMRTETSTELRTRGSLEDDDFHDPFGAPAGVPYTRTSYSYTFAGNNPLPVALMGEEYRLIYEANGSITRLINGVEKHFSLVSAGNHSYLDNLVDPSNNGTASWNTAPGDGVYTLSNWVGRTGNGGGAHFRMAAGQYVNLQLLQNISIGDEVIVFTTVERYNQWIFNPAHRVTQETKDGLVWMRLVRVPSAVGSGQQNNPRFNWQKFINSVEPVFNAVTYSWSSIEIVEEFPVYTYFWDKRMELGDDPIEEDPTDDDPVVDPPIEEDPIVDKPTDDMPVDVVPTDGGSVDDRSIEEDPADAVQTNGVPTDDRSIENQQDARTNQQVSHLPQTGAITSGLVPLGGLVLAISGLIAALKKKKN